MVELLTTFECRVEYTEKNGRMSYNVICEKETDF